MDSDGECLDLKAVDLGGCMNNLQILPRPFSHFSLSQIRFWQTSYSRTLWNALSTIVRYRITCISEIKKSAVEFVAQHQALRGRISIYNNIKGSDLGLKGRIFDYV
jgi:hypothetical protein